MTWKARNIVYPLPFWLKSPLSGGVIEVVGEGKGNVDRIHAK